MTSAGTRSDARTALLERLIDHAALFPPASMDMPEALAEDRAARESPHAWMIGRFVCPASRLGELAGEMPLAEAPPLSVVLDGAAAAGEDWVEALIDDLAAVADALERAATIVATEAYLPTARPAPQTIIGAHRAVERVGCTAYFELRADDGWRDALPATIGALAAVGARVKVRCGGAAVPPVDQLALVVASCAKARVRFKATAGLHHPVRGEEHGFLNLLAAAVFAHAHGLSATALEQVLAETDPAAFEVGPDRFAAAGLSADAAQVAAARAGLFDGYGSCSWREPVDGLRELGIL